MAAAAIAAAAAIVAAPAATRVATEPVIADRNIIACS